MRVYPEAQLHKKWKSWLGAARYFYNKAIAVSILRTVFDCQP
ncbi:hypothetical protein Q5692_09325 [Microcoleus sp. C2C3]